MTKFNVTGMSCAACSARVEKAASKVFGVTECSVSLLTNTLCVKGNFSNDEIIKAVTNAGYKATVFDDFNKSTSKEKNVFDNAELKVLLKRLITSLIFLIPLMYISMLHTMWNFPLPLFLSQNKFLISILQLIFSFIILVINKKFFISGIKSVIHKSANMDTLVSLGSSISFIYSVVLVFNGEKSHTNHLYFESAAMILTLITFGKLLESISKGKTTDALKTLIKLAPKTAILLIDKKETLVDIEKVKVNDIFIIKPGSNIPVDGIVLEGSSCVDESSLTGESIPIEKNVKSFVNAGTININGFLKCKATRVGSDTTFSQIIRLVQDATSSKAPAQKIADKVSSIFVPLVVLFSLITFAVWMFLGAELSFAITKAVSVLVVSCPCALGLATPVAIMVANGVGAKNGILFKTSFALENLGKTQIVALDKTGTITKGKPEVIDVLPSFGVQKEKLLQIAFALECKSEHPLAKAIVNFAQKEKIQKLECFDFKEIGGRGLKAKIQTELNGITQNIFAGNLKYIEEVCPNICDSLTKEKVLEVSKKGLTPLLFASSYSNKENKVQEFLGIICVSDILKEESVSAIKLLKNLNTKIVMLTGDNELTAKQIAKLCGIKDVIAEVLPSEKQNVILQLKKQGKVCMVGDGINDAPALITADTGIAIGAGNDVALDSANVILVKSKLDDVAKAIMLSRKTLKVIKENLFWAFFYNIILIPLAAGAFYNIGININPMFASLSMSLSSFCVIMNALRLNLFNTKTIKNKISTKEELMETVIKVEGMMCTHCEAHVKEALEKIEGVKNVTANHETGEVKIVTTKQIEQTDFEKAILEAGYNIVK